MEQLDYNLLFRWFVGLSADDPVWDHLCSARIEIGCSTAISRASSLPRSEPAAGPLPALQPALLRRRHADRGLGQHEEFRAEGWQPHELSGNGSGHRGGRNTERDFHGEKRTNDTHLDHRSRSPGCSEKPPARRPSCSHGAPDDGEPQRAHRRCPADRGQRHGRAHDRAGYDRRQC